MDKDKKLEKEKQIKKEISRLKKLFKDLPKNKMTSAEGLIQEAAFMRVTLAEARGMIDTDGILDWFEQGPNAYYREHPATKVYNTMIQRYSSVSKQIFDMLPDEDAAKKLEDDLVAFIKGKP
jgi:hypothetical protein